MPESGYPPGWPGTPFHPSCEFQGKNGRVLYCLECRRLALEYAGCQLVFHRSGSDRLIGYLRELVETPPPGAEPQKIYIGSRNGVECIGLYPAQIKEAVEFLESAVLIMDAEAAQGERLEESW